MDPKRSEWNDSDTTSAAIVTGASRGLGRAIALELARQGVNVAITARSEQDLERVGQEVEREGARALPLPCDVSDHHAVGRMVRQVGEELGPPAILVNNAGTIEPIGRLGDLDPAAWELSLRVNLAGPFHAAQAVLPHLQAAGGGVILNVSSGAAYRPREGWSAYSSAKAGLAMLTRTIDHEWGESGVRAYGFQPGVVDTEMQVKIRASGMNEVSRIPRENLSSPEEPARVAAMICLLAPKDLSGQDLSVRDEELLRRLESQWAGRSRRVDGGERYGAEQG